MKTQTMANHVRHVRRLFEFALLMAATAAWLLPNALADTVGLHGRVLEQNAQGVISGTVANASVELSDAQGNPIGDAKTDEQGYYSFSALEPGSYRIRISSESARGADQGELVFEAQDGEHVRDFILSQPTPTDSSNLTVSVVESRASGPQPIVNAVVGFSASEQAPKLKRASEDGRVELALSPGSWALRATAAGFIASEVHEVELGQVGSQVLTIVLQRAEDEHLSEPSTLPPPAANENGMHGYVYGKGLSTNASGQTQVEDLGAIANARIELQQESGLRIGSTTTSAEGFYSFPDVPSGHIRYRVSAEGFQPEADGRAFDAPNSHQNRVVNFTLVKGRSTGTDAEGAQLMVTILAEQEGQRQSVGQATIMIWPAGAEEERIIVETADGKTAEPIGLHAGDWTIVATTAEFGMSPATTITLDAGRQRNKR